MGFVKGVKAGLAIYHLFLSSVFRPINLSNIAYLSDKQQRDRPLV
jgi:hypothetical protein